MTTKKDLDQILIVEDSPTQAEQLKYVLEQRGFQVIKAKNGREAVGLLGRVKPKLVISDILMPEMDGYQLCKFIRNDENLKETPLILLTALSEPVDVMKALECGADNFIIKPFKENHLLKWVQLFLMNQDLRQPGEKLSGLDILFQGEKYVITSDRLQIVNLLLSIYEAAVEKNNELLKAQKELEFKAEELEAQGEELRVQNEEQGRLAEAVRQSEEHYHSLFANMLNGFAYCKMHYEQGRPVDFTYLSVNHAFETLTGLKNVIGKRVSEVIPGFRESAPDLLEIYGRVALTGVPERLETYLKALDMWLSISVYSPQKEYFAAVFDVITERKQGEEALLRAKNEWERTFDAVPDLIAIMDDDYHFVRVNRALAEAVGVKSEDLVGKLCYEYIHQTTCPLPTCPHSLLLQDHREHVAEFREWDRDFLVTVSPLLDDSGRLLGSVHVARDITARKQAEEALQRTHDELELRVQERTAQLKQTVAQLQEEVLERQQAEQEVAKLNEELEQRVRERTAELEFANRELESFSYSVSHDLKAPIRAIQGFSRMLLGEHAVRLDQEGHRLLDVICNNTKIMAKLIDDLLSLSRLGRHQVRKSTVNLAEMARQDFQLVMSQEPERDLWLTVEDLPQAWGDRSLINQVMMNLLSNAIKYTRAQKTATIEVGGYAEGQETVYYVKDNGIGFDERYAHKLFGVFQRLHGGEEYEGTGVGLAIVQRIIQRHGGRVWAAGKPGGGATFYFALPKKD